MIKIAIALSVLVTLNAYIYKRVLGSRPWLVAMAGLFVLQVIGPLGDHLFLPQLNSRFGLTGPIAMLDWTSYLSLGIVACLAFYGLSLDLFKLLWKAALKPDSFVNLERRSLLTLGFATAGTIGLGVEQAVAGPEVRSVSIPLKGLPTSFDGFRIVQISDLHVGPLIDRDYVVNTVDIANRLKADLIALTGDFVDGSVEYLRSAVAPLALLKSVHGSYFITGNHEYYWGVDAWMGEFERLGATVLDNRHVVIDNGLDSFVLAGISDLSTLRMAGSNQSDPAAALAGSPKDKVKLLLAHHPGSYDMAESAGFDLQLSGHTHAGQFFPFSLLIPLFHRYYQGLNRHKNMWVYVNRGTGYWGPPIRTGVPSEITLITLRSQPI